VIVGLTGGIASGKSTVTRILRELGAYVVDADVWARKVVEPGQPALEEIVAAFGPTILTSEGTLNRTALGARVFGDEAARMRLNAITHPRVRDGMREETARFFSQHPDEPIVWDVPLLFEGETRKLVDVTVLVYVDEGTQLERLMARDGLSREAAAARIKAQMPIDQKRALADYIVENTGTLEQTREQVRTLWQTLQAQAKHGGTPS
jgi:dephospho-CoA kinase